MNIERLKMSLGEAVFTQRSMRKLKPDAIPDEDIRLCLEAAVKAPNGGNHQLGRFLVVTDRKKISEFGALYREACFFFSSRRRHTRSLRDWSSDVCSSD